MKVRVPLIHCAECGTPFVLRWSLSLSGRPPEYLYQRDCKHKNAEALPAQTETALLTGILLAGED